MPLQFSCPHCGNVTDVSDQYTGQSGPCGNCGEIINIPTSSSSGTAAAGGSKPRSTKGGNGLVIGLVAVAAFLVVGCMCSGVLVALLLPAVQAARESARRSSCSGRHKQIGLGFHNHHDTFAEFPNNIYAEDGTAMESWRMKILPFIESNNIYEQYDHNKKPWNAPENAFVMDVEMASYCCPSNGVGPGKADYLTIYAEPETKPAPLLTKGVRVTFADVVDGTSNTIMVVETVQSVPWPAVDDLAFETIPIGVSSGAGATGISSMHPGGALVTRADGSVIFIPDSVDKEVLNSMITRDGGDNFDL